MKGEGTAAEEVCIVLVRVRVRVRVRVGVRVGVRVQVRPHDSMAQGAPG